MSEQWRVQIKDKRREPVHTDLVVQAVIAFGRQLWDERRQTVQRSTTANKTLSDPAPRDDEEQERPS
jgi:hypothetical protein